MSIIMSTVLNRYFSVWEGLFSNWMIRKHYFKAHFVQKQAQRKIPTFVQNIDLIPSEKIQFGNSVNSIFFVLQEGLFSNCMIIEHYFKVYFVRKQTKGKFSIFDENHRFSFGKISIWRLCKIHIFLVQKGLSANVRGKFHFLT